MACVRLVRYAALMFALTALPAQAFESFGLRNGMTPDQVRAASPAGYALRLNGDFGFIEKGPDLYATVTFCKGRLVSLSRTVDVQTEWFSLADKMIKQYGNPRVTAAANPWAGAQTSVQPGAQPVPPAGAPEGVANGVEMSWRSGRTKYALTAFPAQPAHGAAKPSQQASVSVTDFGSTNRCLPRAKAGHGHVVKASLSRLPRPERRQPSARLHRVGLRHPPAGSPASPASPGVRPGPGGEANLRYRTPGAEASVRYQTNPHVDAGARDDGPSGARDPFRRLFSFLKRLGRPRTEQVAIAGGRS